MNESAGATPAANAQWIREIVKRLSEQAERRGNPAPFMALPRLAPGEQLVSRRATQYRVGILSGANQRGITFGPRPRARSPFDVALLERVHVRLPAVPGVAA